MYVAVPIKPGVVPGTVFFMVFVPDTVLILVTYVSIPLSIRFRIGYVVPIPFLTVLIRGLDVRPTVIRLRPHVLQRDVQLLRPAHTYLSSLCYSERWGVEKRVGRSIRWSVNTPSRVLTESHLMYTPLFPTKLPSLRALRLNRPSRPRLLGLVYSSLRGPVFFEAPVLSLRVHGRGGNRKAIDPSVGSLVIRSVGSRDTRRY